MVAQRSPRDPSTSAVTSVQAGQRQTCLESRGGGRGGGCLRDETQKIPHLDVFRVGNYRPCMSGGAGIPRRAARTLFLPNFRSHLCLPVSPLIPQRPWVSGEQGRWLLGAASQKPTALPFAKLRAYSSKAS